MFSVQVRSVRTLQRILKSRCNLSTSSSLWRNSSDDDSPGPSDPAHPFRRTINVLGNDAATLKSWFTSKKRKAEADSVLEDDREIVPRDISGADQFQSHCDIVVIGGGGVGSSVAYWLKKKAREGLNVVVVERDSTYCKASTPLSVGGLRQQFSLPENIQMSLYGADFIRTIKEHLGDDVDPHFTPHGYLVLATAEGAETLKQNSALQNELGARNELLTAARLKDKFPWLNTDGIALGCHGLEKEGWFDPWCLLSGFRRRAREYGAHYVEGEVVDFEFNRQSDIFVEGVEPGTYEAPDKLVVRMPNGELRTIKFAICVIAAGAFSAQVGTLARMGTGKGMLSVPIPVEPRKRYVYVVNTQGQNAPGLNAPLTIDPNNTYFRRDGLAGNYICGRSPDKDNEPSIENLDVDHDYFHTDVWPRLAARIPAFESLKVCGSWAGYYEHNTFDANGIIGPHPYYHNMYLATGFSGHGIQQTPAVGRAISELIIDGAFRTIDLSRLCFDRILVDEPMMESNIV